MKPEERDALLQRQVLAGEELARAAKTLADRHRSPLPTIGRPRRFDPRSLFTQVVPGSHVMRYTQIDRRVEMLAVLCSCGARTEMPEKGWCACSGDCGRRFMPRRTGAWWQDGPKEVRVHRFPQGE